MENQNNKSDKEAGRMDFALKIIKYVNTPKRLVMLVALIVSLTFCYSLWENRREVSFWAMSNFGIPTIDEASIDHAAVKLMADVGAQSITVWSINLNQNRRNAIYFRVGQNRMQFLEGTGDLALRKYSEQTANLISVITEKTLCTKLIANTAVGEAARKQGVNYVCYAAVPPSYGHMIGLLVAGFAQKPENEDYVKLRMVSAAEEIIR